MSKCNLIRNQLFLESNGESTYCCESVPPGTPDRKSFKITDWDIKRKHDLEQYEKSTKGWLVECGVCKHHEQLRGWSMRTRNLDERYDTDNLRKAVIKTSNHCNLACRMCGPELSTLWQKVMRDNYNPEFAAHPEKFGLEESTPQEIETLKQKVFTKDFEHLIFSGGESLLSKQNYQIMEYLIDSGLSQNIEVHITTNGTVKIKDVWLEAVKKFKSYTMEFSIDGVENIYEYIRPGGDWNKLVDTINYTKEVAPSAEYRFNYVAQALNAHTMNSEKQKLIDLFLGVNHIQDSFNDCISILQESPEDSYRILTPELINKYGIANYAKGFKYSEDSFKRFMRKQSWLDKAHGKSLKDINPDFFNTKYYPQEAINEYCT